MKTLRWLLAALAALAIIAGALLVIGNNTATEEQPQRDDIVFDVSDKIASRLDEAETGAASEDEGISSAPVYPIAWTVIGEQGIPAYAPVQVRFLPGFDIAAHVEGKAVEEMSAGDGESAVIVYEGADYSIPPSHLLVNLPDLLTASTYDAVYSYSSTSRCAGTDIPGLTGERLDGYADGRQYDPYLARKEFVVPASYHTALMLKDAEAKLLESGYAFCFYDVYRPYKASIQLSQAFTDAYYADPAIQSGIGGWGLTWYAADGVSGHNFGTDVDAGVCDAATGEPVAMPSHFDAFDESGHLSTSQLGWSAVNEGNYRQEVLDNAACMTLHRAMTGCGFRELASEWWHFGDAAGESEMTSLVGAGGLDFQAEMPVF